MSYLIKKVSILYPRLDKTYRFDNAENRSVPCDPTETGAKYETSFVMDGDTATALMGEMAVAYNTARKPSWPEKVPMPFSREEETYVGKCNLKGSFDGKQSTLPPKHFDAKNNPLESGFQLTSGSTANLFVEFVPYHSSGIGTGVSLRLRAVQVLTYKPLEAASPFEATDGDFDTGSPFGEGTSGFDSTEEAPDNLFVEEPEVAEVAEVVVPIETPKKKVKSKTAPAPKDEVDLSALVANWDD
tara:strand:- start:3984 stop:4712 length:729 start_codon:yes stop_codon:yes gene_type:complete